MATVHPSRLGLISEDLRPQQDASKRRASPHYDDYKSRPPAAQRMYPERGASSRYGGGHFEGNPDWLDSRREQRETVQVDVWPPSPRAPFKELHQKHHRSSRKSKRHRSPSTDSTSSSEDERRRKARKDKKRSKRSRDRDHDRKRRHRSRSHHRSYSDHSDSDTQHRSKRVHRSRERRSASLPRRAESEDRIESRSPLPNQHEDEDEWVVKKPSTSPIATANNEEMSHSAAIHDVDSDSGSELGPQPLFKPTTTKKLDERAYGGALLRGEGSAMAAFLQDGTDVRIPRRGEIGLTSGEIAQFENVGYVMSGSRHRRMNAVRMRKENQVISAEEKRGILKLQREERERRESILREEFNELVSDKLKASATQITGPPKE